MVTSCAVHIEKNVLREEDKLVMIHTPATRSQLENDPQSLQLSIKPTTLRMKLSINEGKNIYSCTRNNIDDSQLFICKRVNNKLVCLPLSHVCTMRSDLSHLNPKEEVDPREEIRPVSVKFSANDRHQTPTRFMDKQQIVDDNNEDFRHFTFTNKWSKLASVQRDLLFGIHVKIKPDPDAMSLDFKYDSDVVQDIKPKIEIMDLANIYSLTSHLPTPQIRLDLIKKRVKECMLKAKLVSYEEVYQFLMCYTELPNDGSNNISDRYQVNPRDILDALNENALLVRGNWAVKSEVLYGDSGVRECTDVTGIPINLFTAARDYLLWLFNQNRNISRPKYARRVKLANQDVIELFNQLAVYRKETKKWELKLPTDQKFIDSFPEIVQRQKTFWKVRRANKLCIFK